MPGTLSRAVARRVRLREAFERYGARTVRRFTLAIDKAAVAAVRGRSFRLDEAALTRELVDLMLFAFLRSYKQEKSIELSFTSDVRRLSRDIDLDVDSVRNSFTRHVAGRIRDATDFHAERVNRELGRINGLQLSTRDSIREMRAALDEMGLSPAHPSYVETLVRTHSSLALNAANLKADQNRFGLVTGYLYQAVGDDRTDPDCLDRDGLVITADSPLQPPCHWQCRCVAIPMTDEDTQLSEITDDMVDAVQEGWRFSPAELLD
jgi:SPP1 gp7 family putative phage head morphogenesis protein